MEGQTQDRQVEETDMSQLKVIFCNFVSMPKNLIMTASSWVKNQNNIPNTIQESQSVQLRIMSDRQRKRMSITFLWLKTLEETFLICNPTADTCLV